MGGQRTKLHEVRVDPLGQKTEQRSILISTKLYHQRAQEPVGTIFLMMNYKDQSQLKNRRCHNY